MYEIHFGNNYSNANTNNMSILLNDTKSATSSSGVKIDCAKECPCGVPTIPVPDQWLEVMVTGGFKVWHIIFIIIAFVITLVVVYCCFHRCRIPRTKQEIEADLMRTNLTSKFRDYLQEFPNEPTTFIEALKKVQDLEEKAIENDDSGARKRTGWLKKIGKERGIEKPEVVDGAAKAAATAAAAAEGETKTNNEPSSDNQQASVAAVANKKEEPVENSKSSGKPTTTTTASKASKQSIFAAKLKEQAKLEAADSTSDINHSNNNNNNSNSDNKDLSKEKSLVTLESAAAATVTTVKKDNTNKSKTTTKIEKEKRKEASNSSGNKLVAEKDVGSPKRDKKSTHNLHQPPDKTASTSDLAMAKTDVISAELVAPQAGSNKATRARRKRADKPGLARTKATHLRSRGDSVDYNPPQPSQPPNATLAAQPANQLEVPQQPGGSGKHHHHHHHYDQQKEHHRKQHPSSSATKLAKPSSTVIQMPPAAAESKTTTTTTTKRSRD